MQNELLEFFNMVDFCNPGVLGTNSDFRKKYERPILRAKELDANPNDRTKADKLQKELSTIVNEFILKRGNILNAQHLPPKLMQYVCCKLSPLQVLLYEHILNKKDLRHIMDGKQTDTLSTIRLMINICSHPRMIVESYKAKIERNETDKDLEELVTIIRDYERENPSSFVSKGQGLASKSSKFNLQPRIGNLRANNSEVSNKKSSILSDIDSMCSAIDPTQSGKLLVLFRLMQTMRALKQNERIVIVSNYTQTLDFIGIIYKYN
jgi:DNA repair and recombination RAD54-like protein